MSKSKAFLQLFIPSTTVFISSACIMIIELLAGRLIARHLGSSLYTWTSIIGVVLAGITVGNYIGGRFADKFNPSKSLSILFAFASIASVTILMLNNIVGEWIWLWKLSWPTRVFLHITFVFLLPSTALGTISPVVAKMALDKGLATGRTVGTIYAWATAGSIFGTFLAGFYLIAALGTTTIVWGVAAILTVIAILYRPKFIPIYVWAALLAILIYAGYSNNTGLQKIALKMNLSKEKDTAILYEDETPYCYVAVKRLSENPDVREFVQDKLRHSHISMDDVTKLQYFYTNIYAAYTNGLSKDKTNMNMMIIGGGGYAFPQYLEKNYPDSNVEVVEIDPGVTKAAYAAFGLSQDSKIKTINLDARNYVDQLLQEEQISDKKKRYDFIYEDAINDFCVPFQLVTHEFNQKIKTILKDDGMYMINLIDSYDNGQFLGAIINTLKLTFPNVHVATNKISMPELRDTFVVAASMSPFDPETIFNEFDPKIKFRTLKTDDLQYLENQSDNIVLSDNFAPVENLLAPVVKQSAKEIMARKFLSIARKHKANGNLADAITNFELAAQNNESMTILAYNEIGTMQANLGNPANAVEALEYAVSFHDKNRNVQDVIGSLCINLGVLYKQLDNNEKSAESFNKAIDEFKKESIDAPDSDIISYRIGISYAMLGKYSNASEYFAKALKQSKGNPEYFESLINSLELAGKYNDAISVCQSYKKMLDAFGNTQDSKRIEEKIYFLNSKNQI